MRQLSSNLALPANDSLRRRLMLSQLMAADLITMSNEELAPPVDLVFWGVQQVGAVGNFHYVEAHPEAAAGTCRAACPDDDAGGSDLHAHEGSEPIRCESGRLRSALEGSDEPHLVCHQL